MPGAEVESKELEVGHEAPETRILKTADGAGPFFPENTLEFCFAFWEVIIGETSKSYPPRKNCKQNKSFALWLTQCIKPFGSSIPFEPLVENI